MPLLSGPARCHIHDDTSSKQVHFGEFGRHCGRIIGDYVPQ